jgi:hypothetical protein
MVIEVDCPSAVSDGGRVTTGVEDMEKRATTGTTINSKRMRKKVRMILNFRIARRERLRTRC